MVFVFDGSEEIYESPKKQNIGGFKIIFSKSYKTADQEIIDIVRKSKNPKSLTVVSNDNDIKNTISTYQAKAESISTFLNKMKSLSTRK